MQMELHASLRFAMPDRPRPRHPLIRRRSVLALFSITAVAWSCGLHAEQLDRTRRVGMLLPYIEAEGQAQARVAAFQTSLHDRGWRDHEGVEYEIRYAGGRVDRLPDLAADLVRKNVDVILTAGTEATDAALKATTTIPIIMAAVGDPEAAGF